MPTLFNDDDDDVCALNCTIILKSLYNVAIALMLLQVHGDFAMYRSHVSQDTAS